ncbi:MAG: hypothetical protein ACLFMN_07585, partial [Desulfobacterales bacterium]
EKTVAIALLAGVQACEIRGNIDKRRKLAKIANSLREIAPPTIEDRPMDSDIANVASAISDSALFASLQC